MKNPKKLNRKQKSILSRDGYNLHDWLFVRYEDGVAVFVHRTSHEILRVEA